MTGWQSLSKFITGVVHDLDVQTVTTQHLLQPSSFQTGFHVFFKRLTYCLTKLHRSRSRTTLAMPVQCYCWNSQDDWFV